MNSLDDSIKSALLGLAIGDAIGVPVEFKSREYLQRFPVTDIMGYGTHSVPPGTFSDDSSLAFCLAEALTQEFNLQTIANNFIAWRQHGYWSAIGTVFDIGISTDEAIKRLVKGQRPELSGGFSEGENGNGSLMRILPLMFYVNDKPIESRFVTTRLVSSITHGHIRSVIACFYYIEFARLLLNGNDKFVTYRQVKHTVTNHLYSISINPVEINLYSRLLANDIYHLSETDIKSTGYVLHTLEAAIWCLLTTNNYRDAVLKAVNLGNDTDTTAAVTGGLAGLLYGVENIPGNWLEALAKKSDIEQLAIQMATALKK